MEKDSTGQLKAILTFENFDKESDRLEGVWKDLKDDRQLPIHLTKNFDIDYGNDIEWTGREIIQPVSLRNHYFKLVVSKEKDSFSARVTGLTILEKKTDKLLQEFDVSCRLLGLDNISIDDYNFDGVDDFSVFEQSYAGPNTSSFTSFMTLRPIVILKAVSAACPWNLTPRQRLFLSKTNREVDQR